MGMEMRTNTMTNELEMLGERTLLGTGPDPCLCHGEVDIPPICPGDVLVFRPLDILGKEDLARSWIWNDLYLNLVVYCSILGCQRRASGEFYINGRSRIGGIS